MRACVLACVCVCGIQLLYDLLSHPDSKYVTMVLNVHRSHKDY